MTTRDYPVSHRAAASSISRRKLLTGVAATAASVAFSTEGPVHAGAQEDRVEQILGQMTLTEKIGQLFVIHAAGTVMPGWYSDLLYGLQPGGVIFVAPNIGSPDQIRTYISAIHQSGRYVPPFVAVDQEGGPVARVPGDSVPGAMYLGTLPDEEVERLSRERARFLKGFGFDVNFAPVADVAYSPYSTMIYRSFGSDPFVIASKVDAVVRGSRSGGVASAAKHFPGHGRTQTDSHGALPRIDLSMSDWFNSDAVPFKAAVDANVEMVMYGHLEFTEWDSAPTSLSRTAVRVLRDDLNYDGLIITDDLGMGALWNYSPHQLVDRCFEAGIDLILYTSSPVPFGDLVAHVRGRIERGELSEANIEASARRLLRMKLNHFG
jgi:beta-N-acetylhexosaminidase